MNIRRLIAGLFAIPVGVVLITYGYWTGATPTLHGWMVLNSWVAGVLLCALISASVLFWEKHPERAAQEKGGEL